MTEHDPQLSSEYCTFFANDQMFGIAVSAVREVLKDQRITSVPEADPSIRGLLNLRGQIVLCVDLRIRLGCGPVDTESAMHIVVQVEDETISLLVDAVGDVISLSSEAFRPTPVTVAPEHQELISAIYRLETGIVQLLDLSHLLPDTASVS